MLLVERARPERRETLEPNLNCGNAVALARKQVRGGCERDSRPGLQRLGFMRLPHEAIPPVPYPGQGVKRLP